MADDIAAEPALDQPRRTRTSGDSEDPREPARNNLARNIGGSVGIAFLSTMLARRSQTFQDILVSHLTQSNPVLHERLAQLQHAFSGAGPAQALRRTHAALYGTIQQQATLLGYVWIVRNLAVACAILVPLILLLVKRNQPGAAAMGAH